MTKTQHRLKRPFGGGAKNRRAALKRRCNREAAKRRQAEKALTNYERGLRNFLDSAPVAIAIYKNNRFLFSNKAHSRLLGAKSADELIGRSVLDIIDPEFHDIFRKRSRVVREEGAEAPLIAYTCRRLDGQPVFVETIAIPFSYNGQASVMGVAIDVSRRKHAERKLKTQRRQLIRADKMALLGKLASGVAHEINNPNNFIQLNASLLTRIWADLDPLLAETVAQRGDHRLGGLKFQEVREEIPRLAQDIQEGSRRITRIVKELKDFARPDLPETTCETDLNEVIKAALNLTANVIEKSTARLTLNLDPQIPLIEGHFHRLEQVMINLIINACQALEDTKQRIEVGTGFDPLTKQAVITVSDQGQGIAPEDLPRVMDPFFTTKRDIGGTGLGLSVSSRITADYGGTMEFSSKPGLGTVVRLSFPVPYRRLGVEDNHG